MKKIISLILSLLIVISASACNAAVPTQKDSASTGKYPITLTDHAGREVVIEKKPEKLVSCYYITTSLLMALGLEDEIVGIEDNPDYRPIYALSAPQLLELPWVGTAKTLDVESCAALEPELIILPLRLKDAAESLEKLGFDVLLVNPESQQLLGEMIRMVGTATDTEDKADALITFIEAQKDSLESTLSGAESPAVYLAGNSGLLQTAGDAMYQSDMIRLAGGKNVAATIEDSYWAEIDYEQLLTWDPEYIILASNASYTVDDVLSDPNLTGCKAIKNGNVYQLPVDAEAWDSPVPSSILGALWLANILHPELLTDTDCHAVMDDYYETFYNFSYSQIEK